MGKDKKDKKAKKDKAEKRVEAKESKALKPKKAEKSERAEKKAKTEKLARVDAVEKTEVPIEEVSSAEVMKKSEKAYEESFNAMDFVTRKVGGKWKMKVVYALRGCKSMRYSEIKANVPGITDMMLSSSLRELVEDGLVERKQFSEVPLRVEYQIAQLGERLIPALCELVKWAVENGNT